MGQQYSSEQPQVPEDNDDNFMVATEHDNGEMSSDPNPQSFHEFECTCPNGEGGSARTCAACNRLSGSLSQNHHGKQQQQRQQEQQDETSSIESIGDEEQEDYFVKSSTRHHVLNLSNQSLSRLTPSIANLHNLTRINLSNNHLVTLPRELGYLDNLRSLDISGNRLVALPGSISMLTRLKALNISRNQLKTLPSSMGTMPRLMIIIAHSNGFTHLPVELGRMPRLASLNISQNPLRVLPAELVMNPSLRKLVAEDCAFEVDDGHVDNLVHDPPSLLEICARQIVRSKIVVCNTPEKLRAYFDRVQWCSFCKGPFFDACIKRTRYIERVAGQHILIEYRLCSAHWVTEDERILNMFASQELYEPRHITVIDNYGNSNGYMLEASSPPAFPSSSRTCSSLKSSSASSPAPPSSYTLHVHSAMIQLH